MPRPRSRSSATSPARPPAPPVPARLSATARPEAPAQLARLELSAPPRAVGASGWEGGAVPRYGRVVVKLSGEALADPSGSGADPASLAHVATEILAMHG